jgi:hypothetical protein
MYYRMDENGNADHNPPFITKEEGGLVPVL